MKVLFTMLLCGLLGLVSPIFLEENNNAKKVGKKGTYAVNAITAFSAEHSLEAKHAHQADSAKVADFGEFAIVAEHSQYAKDAKRATNAKYADVAEYAVCANEAKTVMKIMPVQLQHIPHNVGQRSFQENTKKMLSDTPSRLAPLHSIHRDAPSVDDSDAHYVVRDAPSLHRDADSKTGFSSTYRKVYHNVLKADEADYAIYAQTATDAGEADTADKAVYADKAVKAFNAKKADVAGTALNAKHATNAFNAKVADYARFVVGFGKKC